MGENIKKKKKQGGKVVSHFDPHSIPVGGGNTLFCCLSTANKFKEEEEEEEEEVHQKTIEATMGKPSFLSLLYIGY